MCAVCVLPLSWGISVSTPYGMVVDKGKPPGGSRISTVADNLQRTYRLIRLAVCSSVRYLIDSVSTVVLVLPSVTYPMTRIVQANLRLQV